MTDYKKLVEALRCKVGITEEETKCEKCPYGTGYSDCDVERYSNDAADAIEALQAEVNRLKDSNEELREKQTYIDHYGDRWMTSAKDVPTAAYEHGYADGRDEAEAQLPKRGEVVRCGECKYHLPETERTNPYCNRFHCMKPDDWFCADGEREVQE